MKLGHGSIQIQGFVEFSWGTSDKEEFYKDALVALEKKDPAKLYTAWVIHSNNYPVIFLELPAPKTQQVLLFDIQPLIQAKINKESALLRKMARRKWLVGILTTSAVALIFLKKFKG